MGPFPEAARTNYHSVVAYTSTDLFSHSRGGQKAEIKLLVGLHFL